MKLFSRILIGTALCFMVSYFFAALGKLGSFEAVAARYSHDADKTADIAIERKYSADQVQEIEIEAVNTDISFQSVDSKDVTISLKGTYPVKSDKGKALESKLVSGKLTISVDKYNEYSFPNMGLTVRQDGKLVVSIPKSVKKVHVKTVSGELMIKDLALKLLDAETISGDVKGENSEIETLKIDTTSGSFKWRGQLTELNSDSISGDVDLNLKNADPMIDANTVSGDIKITFETNPDLKISLSTTSGELNIAPALGSAVGDKDDYSMTLGNGKGSLRAKTVSGDLNVIKK